MHGGLWEFLHCGECQYNGCETGRGSERSLCAALRNRNDNDGDGDAASDSNSDSDEYGVGDGDDITRCSTLIILHGAVKCRNEGN